MTDVNESVTRLAEPFHVTLTKNTKGYSWEISIHGSDLVDMKRIIRETNESMRKEYGDSQ
jgi:hypothetical protein